MDQNSVGYLIFKIVCYFLLSALVMFGLADHIGAGGMSAPMKLGIAVGVTIALSAVEIIKRKNSTD